MAVHPIREGTDWLHVVDIAHRPAPSLVAWGERMLETLRRLFAVDGIIIQILRHEDGRLLDVPFLGTDHPALSGASSCLEYPRLGIVEVRDFFHPRPMVVTSCRSTDVFGMLLFPTPGVVMAIQCTAAEEIVLDADARRRLTWLGLHIEAALRLRLSPETLRAVIGPDAQPDDGHALWSAVASGELMVVPRTIEGQPHYYFLENPPHRRSSRALSPCLQDAITAICRAQSSKMAAYELGISEGSLSLRLASAAFKLGLSSRTELVRIAAMLTRDQEAPVEQLALTPSEERVLELVSKGLSNNQIASIRGRSVRTIANQVASLLRKTRLPGRRALAVKAQHWAVG